MKNSFILFQSMILFFSITLSTAFAQQPDPNDLKIPLYPLENENEVTKMLEKGDQLVATLKKAEKTRDELLKKYGKKEIVVDGQKVITTQKPVPLDELKLLKPMLPEIRPENVEKLMKELQSLEHNLNNFLRKGPVNMSEPLKKQLTPQKASNNLKRVSEQTGYVSSKDPRGLHNTFDAIGDSNVK